MSRPFAGPASRRPPADAASHPRACAARRLSAGAAALLLAAGAAGCASLPEGSRAVPSDPLERFNRGVFAFNDAVDRAVTKPLAKAYEAVVPQFARQYVGNFFGNLGDVLTAANQLLQGKPALAASDAGRVVVNTVFGFAGLLDIASDLGMEKHREDFGQTLGRWGAPSGPYLVLPVLGPSSVRDGVGTAVDLTADPLRQFDPTDVRNSAVALRVVDTRQRLLDAEKLVEGAALDRYSFLRDAYLQRRRSQIYDGNPPQDDDSYPPPPNYDDEDDAGTTGASPPALPGGTAAPVEPTPAGRPAPGQPR